MRRKEKEITSKRQIEDILTRGQTLRLAMADAGRPYLVPLNYAYADGTIYIHCSRQGKKTDILAQNPQVCFEVTVDEVVVREPKPCGFTTHFKSVIGFGKAVAVTEPAEKIRALSLLMRHYGSDRTEFPGAVVDKTSVLRIDIASMTGKQSPAPAQNEPGEPA